MGLRPEDFTPYHSEKSSLMLSSLLAISHYIWAIAGLKAALDWLQSIGRETIIKHTIDLSRQLQINLADLPGVEVQAPPKGVPGCGIISFTVEDTKPQAIESALGAAGIA